MCFKQTGEISTLGGSSLELVDKFTYQGSGVSSTERHRDATNEGMDCYRYAIHHMKVRPDRSNETQFLPRSGRVDTAIWMH